MVDLSQVSTQDLQAFQAGNLAGVSTPALQTLQELHAEAPQNTPNDALGIANQAANMGIAYANSKSFGLVPKVESAIGAGMAYPFVAAGKTIEGQPVPSYSDLYKIGVNGVQGRVAQSERDSPILTAGAELAGSIKAGNELGQTKAGQAVGDWVRGDQLPAAATYGEKAANFLKATGKSALVGETGYRAYKVGNAAPGDEAEDAVSGLPMGGIVGGGARVLGGPLSKMGGAFTPSIDAAKAPVAALAQKYNIPLGLDDLTSSKFYKTLISEGQSLPFSGSGSSGAAQQAAFNQAVSKTFGQDAKKVTPDIIDKAYNDLGGKFQSFTSGKTFQTTPDYFNQIENIKNNASRLEYGTEGKAFIDANLDRLHGLIQDNGNIRGENLDLLRRQMEATSRNAGPEISRAAGDVADAVTGIISSDDPALQSEITQTKYHYKNLKAIEGISAKDLVDGNISPALLTNAVRQKYGVSALASGNAGDLGNLATIGQAIKPSIPNSGTAQRTMARNLLTGDVAGMGASYFAGGLPAVGAQALATVGGLGINRALQNRNVNQQLMAKILQGGGNSQQRLLPSAVTGNIGQQMAKLLAGGQ